MDTQDVHRQQIERLLGFQGVGPLVAAAIASNLGVPSKALDAILEVLVEDGRVVPTGDGRFALPSTRRQT